MEKLKPIPTTWSVRWRAIRRHVIPVVVFAVVISALALNWRKLDGGGVPGIAEGVRSVVTCPQPALLEELRIRPYQWVEAGQVVATLRPADPRAGLDLLQSQLQIARLSLEPSLADQNALDFERLRVEKLRLREELATAEVELQRAESALRRNTLLRKDKLVSEDAYELSLRDRDQCQAQIAEKRKAIGEIDSRLTALRSLGEPESPGNNQALRDLVSQLDTRVRAAEANSASITVHAPISGMVQTVHRQMGEYLAQSEPLLTINSSKAERIVGYLRQPYVVEPEVGMKVEVLNRSRQRRKFQSEIAQVGAQVEVITNALAVLRPFATVDVGLPIVINIPPHVSVRPGEAFDILFPPDFSRAGAGSDGGGSAAAIFSQIQ
jgi:multidrug resistance efflux pump